MKFEIEIDPEQIQKKAVELLAESLAEKFDANIYDHGYIRNVFVSTLRDITKDVIYKNHKDEIVDRIVNQASESCARKAVAKLLDEMKEKV